MARRLVEVEPWADVTLLEKEPELARHQSSHSSGVVHAGLYYEPGSLKATACRRGVSLLRDLCAANDLPYVECGKVVVALDAVETARLDGIAARARANGVPGVRMLDRDGLAEVEPHVRGVAALHSPTTAITDFAAVTRVLARDLTAHGGTVRLGAEVTGIQDRGTEVLVTTRGGDGPVREAYERVVVCAGLHADRVARLAGQDADPRIVPFRGEYLRLRPARRDLVRGLVYPVPDPRYPFLGVHVTPRVDGEVLLGPNAVLALAREGYGWTDVSARDLRETVAWQGFWRFASRHWRTGVREVVGSASHAAYLRQVRKYLPELRSRDVLPGPTGVRAQAMARDGSLVDDFRLGRSGRVVSLRNAPSPAATSSLAVAEHVVDLALDRT